MVGFARAFDQTDMAKRNRGTLAQPYEAPNPKCEEALIKYKYALSGEFAITLCAFWRCWGAHTLSSCAWTDMA